MTNNPSQVLLEFKNVGKTFGSVRANDEVSFKIKSGSIHALIGENGAGKSTIMKILFGLYEKDAGEILFNGQSFKVNSPLQAKSYGIGMVHQHFMLAGPMTALDHIFLDENLSTSAISLFQNLNRKLRLSQLEEIAKKYKMPVQWNSLVQDLSVGFQQRIEILKLLYNRADILILDEPTAVLTPQEITALFDQLRSLKKDGKTIIIITHKLKEVMALADEVTVFRAGKSVAHRNIVDTNIHELSELMVGRKLIDFKRTPKTENSKPVVLLQDITLKSGNSDPGKNALQNISFKIESGEVVGIAGIEGNGQSELIEVLLNPIKHQSNLTGKIFWNGEDITRLDARSLKEKGQSYFPEDRLKQGVLIHSDMKENFILGMHRSRLFQKFGWLLTKKIKSIADQQMKDFDVRPLDSDLLFQNFSGGNQQKFVVARELFRKPQFLIAAQPTRGVDIGAIERIHAEINGLKAKGAAVILISSDLDEVLKLSDRILVMYEGKIVGEILAKDFDEKVIGHLMLEGAR